MPADAALPPRPTAPPLDPLGAAYVDLAFAIERHAPGFIDGYFGSPSAREAAEAAPTAAPADLLRRADELTAAIDAADLPDARRDFLRRQAVAMAATLRRLAGEAIPYREEVRLLYDIEAEQTPEAKFEAAIAELDDLLPGRGPVGERMVAWRDQFTVTPEGARRLIDVIVPELRRRTERIVPLPADEAIEFRFVSDRPWSGYNWYLGNNRSRVELNTDLPIHATRLTDLLAHEGYPGHHTEHALKERLYLDHGRGEQSILLINTPECVVSEGIATLAEEAVFNPGELVDFRSEVVYPAAGLSGDPAREIAIGRAQRGLKGVDANAALLLHDAGRDDDEVVAYLTRYGLESEARARHRLRFIRDPLWRAYIFTYHAGHDLLGRWLAAAPDAEARRDRFRTLLTEAVTPTWVRQAAAADPVA